jgi:hypothetical protein
MLDRKTIGWTPGPLSGAFFVISGGFTISGGPDMAPGFTISGGPDMAPGFTISGGPDMAPGLPQPADVPSADSR